MGWFPPTCETFPFSAALGGRATLTLQSVNQILKIQNIHWCLLNFLFVEKKHFEEKLWFPV
jgi:hypothetical protein